MTTACLILFPVVFFFTCDLKNLSTGNRLLAAAFQSVTTRTAGFNTIDISKMSEPSKAVMILLMLIGGSPWFYSRWNENHNIYSSCFKCNCHIPKSGKCRGLWTKTGISCDKKCSNNRHALFCIVFLRRACNQYI